MTDTLAETKVPLRLKRRSVVASTIGNILEWYEWSAYAVFTPFIAAAMFNSEDKVSSPRNPRRLRRRVSHETSGRNRLRPDRGCQGT